VVIDHTPENLHDAKIINALTDVWVPHYPDYFPDEFKPFLALVTQTKKTLWVYFYSEGANEKLQDPTLHYLAKFWWSYRLGLKGMGYWANQYRGDSWNRKVSEQRYDTSLIYQIPGGVVPSRRWQAWRCGWQDYNMLSLLRDKLSQASDQAGLKELDLLVQDVVNNPGNQAKTDAVREWAKARL
jgi:hypothetical protein